jgi:hypothetical protein
MEGVVLFICVTETRNSRPAYSVISVWLVIQTIMSITSNRICWITAHYLVTIDELFPTARIRGFYALYPLTIGTS